MKSNDVRNWLGIYFLLITGIFGAYLLLFRESPLLPISKTEAVDAFEILIPVLLAQIMMVFRWFASDDHNKNAEMLEIPEWVVKGPPILVLAILVGAVIALIIGNSGDGKSWAPGPDTFKAVVTFCVSILNASTVFIVSKYFRQVASSTAVEAKNQQ